MPVQVVPWDLIGDRLEELAKQGLPNHEIAMALSREFNAPVTRNAVIGRRRRVGINKAVALMRVRLRPRNLPPSKPAKPVSFMALEAHHCRWPIDMPSGDVFYCGAQKAQGLSYCVGHAKMAFHTPARKGNLNADKEGSREAVP